MSAAGEMEHMIRGSSYLVDPVLWWCPCHQALLHCLPRETLGQRTLPGHKSRTKLPIPVQYQYRRSCAPTLYPLIFTENTENMIGNVVLNPPEASLFPNPTIPPAPRLTGQCQQRDEQEHSRMCPGHLEICV